MNTHKWSGRRIFRIPIVAAAAAVLLTSCSPDGGSGESGSDESNGALAMSFPSQQLSYWNLQVEKMAPIIEAAGYEFLTDDPQNNAQNQINNWQNWINRGDVRAIMGFPVDWDAIVPVTQEAVDAGIPVIGYTSAWDGVEYVVGMDLVAYSATIGEATGEWITENHPGETVKVAVVGNSNTDLGRALTEGFTEGLSAAGADAEVMELGNEYTRDAAYNAAQSQLVAHPDTYIWYGHGPEVLGARQAIIDSGVSNDDPDYYLTGAAGDQEVLDIIATGDDLLREAWFFPTGDFAEANAGMLICAAEGNCETDFWELTAVHASPENAATLEP